MKPVLCAFLLFALPAFATISQRQSPVSQWNSSSSSTCYATLSGSSYHSGDLIVVWTYWTTSGTNNLTATVTDSYGNGVGSPNPVFPSAVGPTLQSAASNPIAAQIFYANNTKSGTGNDTVTVTYYLNGVQTNATTSGCVFVEYQGADTVAPLDSVSEAISNAGAAGIAFDSGTVSPGNASLLLFGAGTTDAGTAFTATPWTIVQNSGGSLTEQQIVTGNNTLQRATATSTLVGNWLMQMAVFRAATWSVSQGWSAERAHQTLYADQFPGSTADVQITNAIASLPLTGGIVDARGYGATQQVINAPVIVGTAIRPVTLILSPFTNFTVNVTGGVCAISIGDASGVTTQVGGNGYYDPNLVAAQKPIFILGANANVSAILCNSDPTGGQQMIYVNGVGLVGNATATMTSALMDLVGLAAGTKIENVVTGQCADKTGAGRALRIRPGTATSKKLFGGSVLFENNNFGCGNGTSGNIVDIDTVDSSSGIYDVVFVGNQFQHSSSGGRC